MLQCKTQYFLCLTILAVLCLVPFCHGHGLYINSTTQYRQIENEHYNSHFKSGRNVREPKFLTFDTKNNNIEVEMNFAIPFLSIPVKRAVDGTTNMAQAIMSGMPLANLNSGAIMLAVIVTLVGAGLATGVTSGFAAVRSMFKDSSSTGRTYAESDSWARELKMPALAILDSLDKSLQKYDIDTTACTQRMVCWYIKNSIINVTEGRGSKIDKIVNGLTSSEWALEITADTAIEDAIRAGRYGGNCERKFSGCKLTHKSISNLITKISNSFK